MGSPIGILRGLRSLSERGTVASVTLGAKYVAIAAADNGHLYAAPFCVARAAELHYMRIPSDEAELSASWANG